MNANGENAAREADPPSGTEKDDLATARRIADALADHVMLGEPALLASARAWTWRCACGYGEGAPARSVALDAHRAHAALEVARAISPEADRTPPAEQDGATQTTEYGLAFDCAAQGCEVQHEDDVMPRGTTPPLIRRVNRHAVRVVQRTVTHSAWTDFHSSEGCSDV